MRKLLIALSIMLALTTSVLHADEVVTYTVMEGEDVQTVAGKFNVTVEELTVSNGLGQDEFVAGAVIVIPPKHATGFYNTQTNVYTVAAGDDLYAIAGRFGTTVDRIKTDNDLLTNQIQPGDTLSIAH